MIYTIATTKNKVLEGEKAIQKNGGDVWNDNSFEVKGIKGSYMFDDNSRVLTIEVTDKPWLASWDMIEEKIKEFFA